jgi:hypothetical protein
MNKENARGKSIKMFFSNMFKLLLYMHHIALCNSYIALIGRSRVVERLRVGNRCLNTLIYSWILMLDNLRPGGAIRGISETLGREGRGECCGYFKVFYVVASACVS